MFGKYKKIFIIITIKNVKIKKAQRKYLSVTVNKY